MQKVIEKARVLIEALPYIRSFRDKIFVVKAGGKVLLTDKSLAHFTMDVSMLRLVGIKVVVVHGGGPEINSLLEKVGKKPVFFKGLRVTDDETLQYVEMALARLNMKIVRLINYYGGRAIGLSGNDSSVILAKRKSFKKKEIGLVGDVKRVNEEVINRLLSEGFIPVIMPTGVTEKGEAVNINADEVASTVASSLKAEKLIVLSDVDGVFDERNRKLNSLTRKQIKELINKKAISEGMIPKVNSCLEAVKKGVRKAHIINGNIEHSLLLEIFTKEGIGTEFIS